MKRNIKKHIRKFGQKAKHIFRRTVPFITSISIFASCMQNVRTIPIQNTSIVKVSNEIISKQSKTIAESEKIIRQFAVENRILAYEKFIHRLESESEIVEKMHTYIYKAFKKKNPEGIFREFLTNVFTIKDDAMYVDTIQTIRIALNQLSTYTHRSNSDTRTNEHEFDMGLINILDISRFPKSTWLMKEIIEKINIKNVYPDALYPTLETIVNIPNGMDLDKLKDVVLNYGIIHIKSNYILDIPKFTNIKPKYITLLNKYIEYLVGHKDDLDNKKSALYLYLNASLEYTKIDALEYVLNPPNNEWVQLFNYATEHVKELRSEAHFIYGFGIMHVLIMFPQKAGLYLKLNKQYPSMSKEIKKDIIVGALDIKKLEDIRAKNNISVQEFEKIIKIIIDENPQSVKTVKKFLDNLNRILYYNQKIDIVRLHSLSSKNSESSQMLKQLYIGNKGIDRWIHKIRNKDRVRNTTRFIIHLALKDFPIRKLISRRVIRQLYNRKDKNAIEDALYILEYGYYVKKYDVRNIEKITKLRDIKPITQLFNFINKNMIGLMMSSIKKYTSLERNAIFDFALRVIYIETNIQKGKRLKVLLNKKMSYIEFKNKMRKLDRSNLANILIPLIFLRLGGFFQGTISYNNTIGVRIALLFELIRQISSLDNLYAFYIGNDKLGKYPESNKILFSFAIENYLRSYKISNYKKYVDEILEKKLLDNPYSLYMLIYPIILNGYSGKLNDKKIKQITNKASALPKKPNPDTLLISPILDMYSLNISDDNILSYADVIKDMMIMWPNPLRLLEHKNQKTVRDILHLLEIQKKTAVKFRNVLQSISIGIGKSRDEYRKHGYWSDGSVVQSIKNIEYLGIDIALKANEIFGITFFNRYTKPELDSIRKAVENKINRDVIIVMTAKSDPNGVFSAMNSEYDRLLSYYDVVFLELKDEKELKTYLMNVVNRLNNHQIYGFVFAAHGEPKAMAFGEGDAGEISLDGSDIKILSWIKKNIRKHMRKDGILIFESCSTGSQKGAITPISEGLKKIFGISKVFAPIESTFGINNIKIMKDGKVTKVDFLY